MVGVIQESRRTEIGVNMLVKILTTIVADMRLNFHIVGYVLRSVIFVKMLCAVSFRLLYST